MTWSWVLAQQIATTAASAAVVVTAIIYYRQLHAMKKARQLESLLAIMKYSDDLQLRQARYLILEHGEELGKLFQVPFSFEGREAIDEQIRKLSAGAVQLHHIDLSINSLNNICYLIRFHYAPTEATDALVRNTLGHAWQAFEPYIMFRRSRVDGKHGPSRYAEHLEWFIFNKM